MAILPIHMVKLDDNNHRSRRLPTEDLSIIRELCSSQQQSPTESETLPTVVTTESSNDESSRDEAEDDDITFTETGNNQEQDRMG